MADVATIAILQERLGKQREILNQQLQSALTSRVAIEQAKGVLATRLEIEMDEAFELMRKRSRDERRRLVEIAEEVVNARSGRRPGGVPRQALSQRLSRAWSRPLRGCAHDRRYARDVHIPPAVLLVTGPGPRPANQMVREVRPCF